MKIAIFSDIHGNKYAFFKAIESMQENNVERFLFCGDICGYYYDQNEIIDFFRKEQHSNCILGNHDKMFLDINDGKMDGTLYKEKYGDSTEKLLKNIKKENLQFLRNLQAEYFITIDNCKIAMFHGSPWSINDYCYPDSDFSRYLKLNYDFIFQGHTHYRMNKIVNNMHVINPGSIGQPRDASLPSYVLLDTQKWHFEFISIKYNIEKLVSEIKKERNEQSYLIDVLLRSAKHE
jgi:putative phosphoesterase